MDREVLGKNEKKTSVRQGTNEIQRFKGKKSSLTSFERKNKKKKKIQSKSSPTISSIRPGGHYTGFTSI